MKMSYSRRHAHQQQSAGPSTSPSMPGTLPGPREHGAFRQRCQREAVERSGRIRDLLSAWLPELKATLEEADFAVEDLSVREIPRSDTANDAPVSLTWIEAFGD